METVVVLASALGRVRARGETLADLRRRGVDLGRRGVDLEAAWCLDASAEKAPSPQERARMEINASHGYFMAGGPASCH